MHEEFKALLKSTGISKQKVAEMAGVTPPTVSRWVNGGSAIPPLVIEKLKRIDNIVKGN